MTTLEALILAWALHFAPITHLPQYAGHEETAEQARARYVAISHDIAEAVKDRKDAKSAAALLLAWAVGESALSHDADVGPCHRVGKLKLRCDGGAAASIFQLHAHRAKDGTPITVAMLFADRALAARIALRGLIGSQHTCASLEAQDRFSAFATGAGCVAGNKSVRARYRLWREVSAWVPPAEPSS